MENAKHLASFTSFNADYPSFISIRRAGDKIEVIVRSERKADGSCGDVASISLTLTQFCEVIEDAIRNI